MSFFLTEEMEEQISLFLYAQNEQICKAQLQSPAILPEFKEMITKTMEAGNPVPYFDTRFGYYSISFTPCEYGNRVYVHHHISDTSEMIYDPSTNADNPFDAKTTLQNTTNLNQPEESNVLNDDFSPFQKLDNPTSEYNIEVENTMQQMMQQMSVPTTSPSYMTESNN